MDWFISSCDKKIPQKSRQGSPRPARNASRTDAGGALAVRGISPVKDKIPSFSAEPELLTSQEDDRLLADSLE